MSSGSGIGCGGGGGSGGSGGQGTESCPATWFSRVSGRVAGGGGRWAAQL